MITPISSNFLMRWWMAAPEMPHSRAISRYGIRAFFIRNRSIFLSVASNVVFAIIVYFFNTPNSLPIFTNASTQRSSCSVVWPADT